MAGRGPKTTGREGQMDAGLPRGRTLGRKVGGREGDLSTQPPAPASNQEAPSPHHTGAPPFTRPAPGPLGLTPLPPLRRSPWKAQLPSRGSELGLPQGLWVEADGGVEGAAPPPGGEGSASLRRARPGCRALGVHRLLLLLRGRPGPAALCPGGPPCQQQPRALGRHCGFCGEERAPGPGRETGAAPRGLGGASAKQMVTRRGERDVRRARYPRPKPTALPLESAFTRHCREG